MRNSVTWSRPSMDPIPTPKGKPFLSLTEAIWEASLIQLSLGRAASGGFSFKPVMFLVGQ
jgi:hypothetical protein